MAKDLHTVAIIDGSTLLREDRLVVGLIPQLAHGVGGGAGAAVAIPVTGLQLPPTFGVELTPSQDATCWVSARTQTGFTVNIAPRLAASTLAAGAIDVFIYA